MKPAALLLLSLTLAGCGLKGDLYLPPAPEAGPADTPATAPPAAAAPDSGADGPEAAGTDEDDAR